MRKYAPHFAGLVALLALAGCTPEIGDKCVLSTDCSLRGDRLCDTSQPGGYCTVFNCRGNLCPDQAACVLFNPSIQGCGFSDRSPSRTGRTFCVKQCQSDADCRDGYVCADPRTDPWSALILDDVQSQRVCLVRPFPGAKGEQMDPGSAVCGTSSQDVPDIDAAAGHISTGDEIPDATVPDARADAGADATLDASDAGADAPEGG